MPEYSEPNENTVARLALLLSHTILKNRNQHMAAIGLTASQADCLRFCVEEGGGTVTELKDYLQVTHQAAQRLLRRMVEKGLVELRRSELDNRCRVFSLTIAGQKAAEQMLRSRERTGGKLLNGMTEQEQRAFIRYLELAYENVKRD